MLRSAHFKVHKIVSVPDALPTMADVNHSPEPDGSIPDALHNDEDQNEQELVQQQDNEEEKITLSEGNQEDYNETFLQHLKETFLSFRCDETIEELAKQKYPELRERVAYIKVFNKIHVDKAADLLKVRNNVSSLQRFLDGNFRGMQEAQLQPSQRDLMRDINEALGRDGSDSGMLELGNMYVPRAYANGSGWWEVEEKKKNDTLNIDNANKGSKKKRRKSGSASDLTSTTEISSTNEATSNNIVVLHGTSHRNSMLGFDLNYIYNMENRKTYFSANMPKSTSTRKYGERNSLIVGTAVVTVLSAIKEFVRTERKYQGYSKFTNVPDKIDALLLTGMYVQPTLKNVVAGLKPGGKPRVKARDWNQWLSIIMQVQTMKKVKRGNSETRVPIMDNMPSYKIIRERVKLYMNSYIRHHQSSKTKSGSNKRKAHSSDGSEHLSDREDEDDPGMSEEETEFQDDGSPKSLDDIAWLDPFATSSNERFHALAWAYLNNPDVVGIIPTPVDDDDKDEGNDNVQEAREKARNYVGRGLEQPSQKAKDGETSKVQVPPTFKVHPIDIDMFNEFYSNDGRDDGAFDLLNMYLGDKYLCGNTAPQTAAERPEVIPNKLGNVMEQQKSAEVIVIKNAFHPDTAKAIVEIYCDPKQRVAFCRQDLKFFCTTVTNGIEKDGFHASFQMGIDSSARYYKAFEPHPLKIQLTQVMENMLRATMKAKYGKDTEVFLNQLGVNVAELEHRTGFAYHHDANMTNTCPDNQGDKGNITNNQVDKADFRGGSHKAPLPTRQMMPVVTAVFTGPRPSGSNNEENYKLTWKELKSLDILTSLNTGDNYVHIQYACQAAAIHGGKQIQMEIGPHCWRLTITFRGYCNPAVNLDAWMACCELAGINPKVPLIGDSKEEKVYGVIDKIKNPHTQGRSALAQTGDYTIKAQNSSLKNPVLRLRKSTLPAELSLSSRQNSDVYPTCPTNLWPDNVC